MTGTKSSASQLPAAAETVLTFLESVGRRSEAELYLGLFRKLPKQSFAVVAVEGPVIRHALDSLVEQLRFLAELGLYAPVVVGLFEPDRAEQAAARLVERLGAAGLDADLHGWGEGGLQASLTDELTAERIPVVTLSPSAGDTERRFDMLGGLLGELRTTKLVVLRRRGGMGPHGDTRVEVGPGHLLPSHGGGISIINLQTDAVPLVESGLLVEEDRLLLQHLEPLLLGPSCPGLLVSVASPFGLLRELFTVKGAGTLLKRGSLVERMNGYADIDLARLERLLEKSFARRLRAGFFDSAPLALYVEQEYRSAAIVHASKVAPFLSKFAVDPIAQGEGLGQDLWAAMRRDFPALFWRARPDNPITAWYVGVCDGMVRVPRWNVYWRGIEPERVGEVVVEATSRSEDFVA